MYPLVRYLNYDRSFETKLCAITISPQIHLSEEILLDLFYHIPLFPEHVWKTSPYQDMS